MAIYKRLPRGKKKATNEFVSVMERIERWIVANFRRVLTGSAIVAVILCVVFGVSRYSGWREAKAADALAMASQIVDPQSRHSALVSVVENFGSTSAVREALALLGNEAFSEGKFDDAVRWYDDLAEKSGRYPMLSVYALHQLGAAFGELGQWDKSAESYHRAGSVRGNIIKAESGYGEATALEALGKYGEAKALYEQIIDNSKNEDQTYRIKSEERILWLLAHQGSQG